VRFARRGVARPVLAVAFAVLASALAVLARRDLVLTLAV
jgi:hypothetical protein